MLSNSFTDCKFKAEFDQNPALITRLNTLNGFLALVSAIQKAFSLQISTLVHDILTSGNATAADGSAVE
jgi:hypothetical protein